MRDSRICAQTRSVLVSSTLGPEGETIDLRAALAARQLESLHPALRRWRTDGELAAAVDEQVERALARCVDSERAAAFRARCPVEQLGEHAYRARLLTAPDGRRALVELRFKGLNVDEAFVELSAHDFALNAESLAELGEACRGMYGPAKPRWLRVWVTGSALGNLGGEPDMHVLVGRLSELSRDDDAPMEARPPTDAAACHASYAAAYDAFARSAPAIAAEVERIDEASLAAQIDQGVTLEAFVDGAWAGYVAAMPAPYLGAEAYCMQEQLLAPAFRGHGLGPALQRRLIQRLPVNALLWGTIHAKNAPSLATARRVGRVEVGHHRMLTL